MYIYYKKKWQQGRMWNVHGFKFNYKLQFVSIINNSLKKELTEVVVTRHLWSHIAKPIVWVYNNICVLSEPGIKLSYQWN